MNKKTYIKYALVVVWMALIFAFSSQGHDVSSGQSTGVVRAIRDVTQLSVPETIVRKSAHVLLYLVLGGLLASLVGEYSSRRRRVIITSVAIAFIYACTDELHQLIVGGRSGQITDVLLDSVASLFGVLFVSFMTARVMRWLPRIVSVVMLMTFVLALSSLISANIMPMKYLLPLTAIYSVITLGVAAFSIHYGLSRVSGAILVVIVIAGLLFWQALKQPAFRLSVDRTILRLPLLGKLLRNLHAARMARTLATMVASRLPLLEGLRLTGGTIRNKVLSGANDDIVEAVRSGGSLSGAMRASGVFPPLLVYLTASGESAGQLDLML